MIPTTFASKEDGGFGVPCTFRLRLLNISYLFFGIYWSVRENRALYPEAPPPQMLRFVGK